jgi:trans-aconitate methyltransferase
MAISSVADVARSLWPRGARLLDIGCGSGEIIRMLTDMGYQAAGAEPQAERIAEARARVPCAELSVAGAEALPFADRQFDGALMVQSLHHVPEDLMRTALAEALRCIAPGGYLAVIEPVAEGSFFEVLRLIDDETEVRAAAQRALEAACGSGLLRRHAGYQWVRRDIYRDVDQMLARIIASDPSRAAKAAQVRPALQEIFRRVGRMAEGGREMEHRTCADIFSAGEARA